MRVTGGQVKGRCLVSPKGLKIRPSSDKIRETIFNLIGQELTGKNVLDLFAGTGSFGLEAFCPDHTAYSIAAMRLNLNFLHFEYNAHFLFFISSRHQSRP